MLLFFIRFIDFWNWKSNPETFWKEIYQKKKQRSSNYNKNSIYLFLLLFLRRKKYRSVFNRLKINSIPRFHSRNRSHPNSATKRCPVRDKSPLFSEQTSSPVSRAKGRGLEKERRGWEMATILQLVYPRQQGSYQEATTMSPIMPTVGHCPVLARGYLCRSRAKRWPTSRGQRLRRLRFILMDAGRTFNRSLAPSFIFRCSSSSRCRSPSGQHNADPSKCTSLRQRNGIRWNHWNHKRKTLLGDSHDWVSLGKQANF